MMLALKGLTKKGFKKNAVPVLLDICVTYHGQI